MSQLAPMRAKQSLYSSKSLFNPFNPHQNYIPESILEDGEGIEDGNKTKHTPGLNFSANDRMKVQINRRGQDALGSKVSSFEDLNLDGKVMENVRRVGHRTPTLVQANMIPCINLGMDVLACAQTGLGKTAAYLLPIVSKLVQEDRDEERRLPKCLILVPTRELAMQINREANVYCCGTGVSVRLLCGGVAIWYQKETMKRGLDILVSTPGRLIHFIREHHVDLSSVKYFVLDEADRMLDMGFMKQVSSIMRSLPPMVKRVNIMCSATLPQQVQLTAADYLRDGYIFVAIGTVSGASGTIEQTIFQVERADKRRRLIEILGDIDFDEKILIFCSRRVQADALAAYLNKSLEIPTTWIHAKRSQRERDAALKEFVQGEKQVLVASDVAARGLDIPKVGTVINYDLPQSIEEYVQRIGRTGRAGHIGKAISFFELDQDDHLRAKLGSVLHDAGQCTPDWLLETEMAADNNEDQLGYSIPAKNYPHLSVRRRCVPLPIEAPDDTW